ncbi:hypothetical protein TARUN_4742 [Trichoderma arundinaceum]|uniref:Uncharacterized protein n=1 Tax=Trichoderma arundinaceum TaxID=490622 RepID=A0A395NNF8_TRIAR|nr:hypothetical protein TARUN_4742 [Trichoderma arundinaceum]
MTIPVPPRLVGPLRAHHLKMRPQRSDTYEIDDTIVLRQRWLLIAKKLISHDGNPQLYGKPVTVPWPETDTLWSALPQQHTRQRERVTRPRKPLGTGRAASLKIARQLTHATAAATSSSHRRQRRRSGHGRDLFPCTPVLGAGSTSGRMGGTRMNKSPPERRSKPKLAATECAGRLIGQAPKG